MPEDSGAPCCLASEEHPDEPEVQWRLVQTCPRINSPYLFVYYFMTTHFLSNEIELYTTKIVNGGEEEVVTYFD
jgi:hypothetical protein